MPAVPDRRIVFARLSEVPSDEILEHMSDPRVARHMPLLTGGWDSASVARFIAEKEMFWRRHGLGHWAILSDGRYVGWGGFQKEGGEWDFGLVLRPDSFGLGPRILRKAVDFALERRISEVTFLLPRSRMGLSAMERIGAELVGGVDYRGKTFRKFRFSIEGLRGRGCSRPHPPLAGAR